MRRYGGEHREDDQGNAREGPEHRAWYPGLGIVCRIVVGRRHVGIRRLRATEQTKLIGQFGNEVPEHITQKRWEEQARCNTAVFDRDSRTSGD